MDLKYKGKALPSTDELLKISRGNLNSPQTGRAPPRRKRKTVTNDGKPKAEYYRVKVDDIKYTSKPRSSKRAKFAGRGPKKDVVFRALNVKNEVWIEWQKNKWLNKYDMCEVGKEEYDAYKRAESSR